MSPIGFVLGVVVGIPLGWSVRAVVAALESTGWLPSNEDALRVLGPVWEGWELT